jgi:hypothetical protein
MNSSAIYSGLLYFKINREKNLETSSPDSSGNTFIFSLKIKD